MTNFAKLRNPAESRFPHKFDQMILRLVSELAMNLATFKLLSVYITHVMAHDYETVLNNVLAELANENHSKQAAASAAAAILLNQAPEGTTLSPNVVPAVVPLLSHRDVLIQVCTTVRSPIQSK